LRNLPPASSPLTNLENLWGNAAVLIGSNLYPVILLRQPTTVTIYNDTADGTWRAIATGLSGVRAWRL